jgi:hypothetical protein
MENEISCFRLRPDVRYRKIFEEGVVLRQAVGEVLVLNGVGIRIVELFESEASVRTVAAQLALEYEVEAARLEGDVWEFVQDLRDAGFLELVKHAGQG